ncbi:hypothetical protein BRYFOR_08325 [Marvinbryantia formatexigens DSM 14469]|uniref:Uncharacterized protein n=1 Tax=Marvinbryantia formatexigens DSM 14469 TaxID=478749 RepID=C6LI53_9FIRM|nr:hypothetical protein BRYFOR_08325 [Marvinbryantia formatexigens DSM 14469]
MYHIYLPFPADEAALLYHSHNGSDEAAFRRSAAGAVIRIIYLYHTWILPVLKVSDVSN